MTLPQPQGDGQASAHTKASGNSWHPSLLDWEGSLPEGWEPALLPIGRNKRPIDPATGELLTEWQKPREFTEEELLAAPAWGLRLGPTSGGILALDFDGPAAWDTFTELFGVTADELPKTVSWTSGKPGRCQMAFRVPEARWPELANRKATVKSLEFRWAGQQSVFAGVHPEPGCGYQWVEGRSPYELQVAIAPSWLLDQMPMKSAPSQASLPPAAPRGGSGGELPLLEFISRQSKELVERGSEPGANNDEGLALALDLLGTEAWLLSQGAQPMPTAQQAWDDYMQRSSAKAEDYSFGTAKRRFNGAKSKNPTPSTPLEKLLTRLAFHRKQRKNPQQAVLPQKRKPAPPAASFQETIRLLPDGWAERKDGPPSASQLSVGEIAGMLPAHLLRFNEMTNMAEVQTTVGWVVLSETDIDSAYVILSQKGWIIGVEPITKAILHVARQQKFHPVQQYLRGVEADENIVPFDLNQIAPQLLRSKSPLHVAMVRAWFIGAVARAMEPGCKMDYCLTLQGEQGLLKSEFFSTVASKLFYCSSAPEQEIRFIMNVHSCWIFELAELDSHTSRRESGRLKNTITTPTDLITPPYGRAPERKSRSSVFCGTSNKKEFFQDDTGNRRFWVVPIDGTDKLNIPSVKEARDGIWKAAVIAWRAGELPMLPAHLEAESEAQNEQFNVEDAWLAMLRAWVDGKPLAATDDGSTFRSVDPSRPFSSAEALHAAGLRRLDQIAKSDETRVAPLLRQLGFKKDTHPVRREGERVRLWSSCGG